MVITHKLVKEYTGQVFVTVGRSLKLCIALDFNFSKNSYRLHRNIDEKSIFHIEQDTKTPK